MTLQKETINKTLTNVFEDMQKIMEDRQNGLRSIDNVFAFDDANVHSLEYHAPFIIDTNTVSSLSHGLLLMKAVFAGDRTAVEKISQAYSTKHAINIPIHQLNIQRWKLVETKALKMLVSLKYAQNSTLRHNLLLTGVKKMVYTGRDTFMSCGLPLKSDNVFYPQFWTGANTLGKILEAQRKLL